MQTPRGWNKVENTIFGSLSRCELLNFNTDKLFKAAMKKQLSAMNGSGIELDKITDEVKVKNPETKKPKYS